MGAQPPVLITEMEHRTHQSCVPAVPILCEALCSLLESQGMGSRKIRFFKGVLTTQSCPLVVSLSLARGMIFFKP